jgi:hypothetical protein
MSMARAATGILTLVACLFVPTTASSQFNAVGFRLGVGVATQGGGFQDLVKEVGGKTESRTGLVAGAYVNYGLASTEGRVSFQGGLGLAQKGVRIPSDGGLVPRTLDITYLDIPILAKASFGSGQFRPYVVAGPVLSLKLSASATRDEQDIDVDDELKGTDFSVALGGGVQRERIGIEVRYVLGLSDITESSDPDESAKNRIWEIVGTYELPIGR